MKNNIIKNFTSSYYGGKKKMYFFFSINLGVLVILSSESILINNTITNS